jgi:hypothetical protein
MERKRKMDRENRPPAFIKNGTSVSWKVKTNASQCAHLDFEWCNHLKEKCGYAKCPFKVEKSLKVIQEDK